MPNARPTVFVVDDDEAMRDALKVLFKSVGMKVEAYASGGEFLERFDPAQPGCLLLDVRMPDMDGLELQRRLAEERLDIPIVFVTGHGDMELAVEAVQAGAVDCLAKPFREQALLESVKRAIEQDARRRNERAHRAAGEARLASLTAREREILDLMITGRENKTIAADLGLSHKTIEYHRNKILRKMKAANIIDLVRMTLQITAPGTALARQA